MQCKHVDRELQCKTYDKRSLLPPIAKFPSLPQPTNGRISFSMLKQSPPERVRHALCSCKPNADAQRRCYELKIDAKMWYYYYNHIDGMKTWSHQQTSLIALIHYKQYKTIKLPTKQYNTLQYETIHCNEKTIQQ